LARDGCSHAHAAVVARPAAEARGTEANSETTTAEPTAARRVEWRRERTLDLGGGLLVAVAYVVLQLFFTLGPQPFDPAKYFETGMNFPDVPADRWTLRSGLILVVRATIVLFGPSQAALYGLPIAAGLVLALAVYALMVVLFQQRALGVAAALLTSLNPNALLNSSFIFPDNLATSALTAGFLFLMLGSPRWGAQAHRWLGVAAPLAAGVCFGWTYLIREFTPLLLPGLVAAILLLGYRLRGVVLLTVAAGVTACVEFLYDWLVFGDPLLHLRKLAAREGSRDIPDELHNVVDVLFMFPSVLMTWRFGWLFILLVAWLLVALAWFRTRRLWLFGAWFLAVWGVLTVLGLASLRGDTWVLNINNVRYWYPAFPPLIMGALGGLALVGQRFWPGARGALMSSAAGAAVGLVILVPGFVRFDHCAAQNAWKNDPAGRWDELRAWFGTGAAASYGVLWTDGQTKALVPAYIRTTFGGELWTGEVREFNRNHVNLSRVDPSQSLILMHKDRLRATSSAQSEFTALRDEWAPVFESSDRRFVVVAHIPTITGRPEQADEPWWILSGNPPPSVPGCGIQRDREFRVASRPL
jgi:hypothetical protein